MENSFKLIYFCTEVKINEALGALAKKSIYLFSIYKCHRKSQGWKEIQSSFFSYVLFNSEYILFAWSNKPS